MAGSVLDVFAGSGLLAFEALSRGAGPVSLVDRDRAVVRHLEQVRDALLPAPEERALVQIRRGDARRALAGAEAVDLVFLDPPYDDAPVPWLEAAAPVARRALVLEHRWGPVLPEEVGALRLERHRRYGDTGLAVYRRTDG